MDFIQDNQLPELVKKHLETSVSKAWKTQESSAFLKLANIHGTEKVLNAFSYLKANGIPPYGEITAEPFTLLATHELLVTAFNIGYKAPTKAPELSPDLPADLL